MTRLETEQNKDHVSVMVTSTATSKLKMNSIATTQGSTSKMPKTFGVSKRISTPRETRIQINTANKVTFTKLGHSSKVQKTGRKMSKKRRLTCSETLKRNQNGAAVGTTPKKSLITSVKILKVTCSDLKILKKAGNFGMDSTINLRRIPRISNILILRLPLIR